MTKYDHKSIEKKWQDKWEKDQVYAASGKSKKPKKYVLVEFPYPSGEGLHMGHLRPYTAGDTYSRYWRMRGFETLYPMGWDAFGLPAENFAIKNKMHPSVSTAKNIANAKRQLKSWGMGFDWSREVNTTDPDYYKWTQWIFLQLYKAGLAYEATGLINWCPKDKTGLANEEVIDGKCERCGTEVEKKQMRQWYLKITEYAEKLLAGLSELKEWTEPVKLQQENWIGKSEGAEIDFPIDEAGKVKRFILLHGRASKPKDNYYPWLKQELENAGFEVVVPDMPNPGEPDDSVQADFVEKNCTLDEQTVLVGHSFGGIVGLRLLERGNKVGGLVLVATPYSGNFLDGQARPTVTTAARKGFDAEKIKNNAGYIEVVSDLTDDIVPLSDGQSLAEKLSANLVTAKASKPHFQGKKEAAILGTCLPKIKVFTTRPETLFGATYMVLAPEHPLVTNLKSAVTNWSEVEKYIDQAKNKSEIQRIAVEKEKTGVELKGVHAINPATKEKIPVWVADYVLGNYGTGAIMAVPAHDERDSAFAKKYNLPMREVVKPPRIMSDPIVSPASSGIFGMVPGQNQLESDMWTGEGILTNSGQFDGMDTMKARKEISKKFGQLKIQYKLRDWVFSRQRYWGEPIPVIHCEKCGIVAVPDKDLPVTLPEVKNYEPTGTGESPLAAIDEWVNVKCPNCGNGAKRETNTMPQWAGSSWYWLRYADPKNEKEFASKKLIKHWTPVDVYFGGMEHTTLHLLYSRFWNLFLYDQGHVTTKEPYTKRVPHGIILASDGEKMSKSRGNVVNPDDIVKEYGADVMRMYEMFLGPHEGTVTWSDKGIVGVDRYLDKVVRFSEVFEPGPDNLSIHKLTKKITEDVESFKFNTAIAGFMEFLNENKELSKKDWESFLKLLAPFAPHITEELWAKLGHKSSIHQESWPEYNEKFIKDEMITVVVQISGKVRSSLSMHAGSLQSEVKIKAMSDENVKKYLDGKEIVKEIFVPDKLINFVVK